MSSNELQKQRDELRFAHAIDYIHEASTGAKKLTTSELSQLNQILTASKESTWRTEPVQIKIPSGQVYKFSIISNPIDEARKILGDSFSLAENESLGRGAAYLYLQLVQHHLFMDANRRTAALAVQWLLNSFDCEIDPHELLEIPVGDVRDATEKKNLSQKILDLIKK
jgi:Fic/DOC family